MGGGFVGVSVGFGWVTSPEFTRLHWSWIMVGRDDNPFNVKLGRIFAPDGTGKFLSLAGRVRRAAKASGRSKGGAPKSRVGGSEELFIRRVIVKVNLVKMGGRGRAVQALHLSYIQRDSAARQDGKGYAYDRENIFVDTEEFMERGKDDRHQFRIVVSAEDSKDLSDLTRFTRKFMSEMENDLETRLDWIAADHYDTQIPHTHIVIRGKHDDGKTLIIPREYISYGMRNLAEELVTEELGYIRQFDAAMMLAKQVPQERFTSFDKKFLNQAVDNVLDLSSGWERGEEAIWRLDMGRLKRLGKMGLVEKIGRRKWRLDENLERTLRRLGERGDILKTYHRAMSAAKLERQSFEDAIYDPFDGRSSSMVGNIIDVGIRDDVNDRAFVVLDGLDGTAIYVDVGKSENIDGLAKDMVVEISPANIRPKKSDYIIAEIASKSGGIYSPSAHLSDDPSARPAYIQAHVRRLEALRRAGHAVRNSDGSWKIPPDYLKRVVTYEKSRMQGKPVDIAVRSRIPLKELSQSMGRTWLDELLYQGDMAEEVAGFGQDAEAAKIARRKYLVDTQLINSVDDKISNKILNELERRDLKSAGKELEREIGKPYTPANKQGRISGIYVKSIERPSGRYAVIDKGRSLSLVPWRQTLERNLGREVSGEIRGRGITWDVSKGREIG